VYLAPRYLWPLPAISGFRRTTMFLPNVSDAVATAVLLPITVGVPKFALALVITSKVMLVPFANASV
tara:strand:- start:628 stop:828 length:201 start_codon:yes stop_codon:yes gene_type:complete